MAQYLPYSFNQGNNVLGHYRTSTAVLSTTGIPAANGVWFSAIYGGPNLAAILRVTLACEQIVAKAVDSPYDFALFSFTGATGKASGASSVVSTLTNQQMRPNMAATQFASGTNGEMRGIGGSLTNLTAATGKVNSGSALGSVAFASIYPSTATGTATASPVGASLGPSQDLFVLQPGISHPLVLATNSGFEIQRITAGATGGDVGIIVTVEWAEVLNL